MSKLFKTAPKSLTKKLDYYRTKFIELSRKYVGNGVLKR